MNILITGHLGYIGSVLYPMALERGHAVRGLDCDYYAGCDFLPMPAPVPTLRKDVRDVTVDDLRGIDCVFHLAALSNDPLGNLNAALTYDINAGASIHLAEVAKDAGVRRFVYSSSCSTYGAAACDDLLTESAAFNPVTPYGESKVQSEQGIAPLADDRFSPVYLRNSTAYGVSPRIRFDLVLNNLVAHATASGHILIKSDGTPWRPLVHIRDIASAFLAAAEAPADAVHNQAFNIGRTDENHRISELADVVASVVPGATVTYAPGGSPDKRCYRVNCDKAARGLPGFSPTWTVKKGAQELYQAYRHRGLKVEDFEGPRFQRIARIKSLLADGALDSALRFPAPAGALR